MLISIILNLNMTGGGPTPPPPPPTPTEGGAKAPEQLALEARKKLIKQDEEDFIILLSGWIASKN